MKANELMIGDWVYLEHTEEGIAPYDEPTKWQRDDYDYTDVFVETHIKPIPLTPEILEKSGFIYKKLKGVGDNEIWRIEDDYYDIDIYEWSDSIWVFRYDCNEISLPHTQVTMSYVHELQHVLRLCGIEKEIEL